MRPSRLLAFFLLSALLAGCGMNVQHYGGGALTQGPGGGSIGGSSSGGGGGSGPGGGPTGPTPTAAAITVNPTFAFTFLTTAPTNLGLANGAVVNAADYLPSVASGGLAVLVATSLPVSVPASDLTFPTTLDSLSLTVGGTAAGIYLVAPTQVSFQIPPGLAPGSYPVVVSQGATQVMSTSATVAALAPAILTAPNTGAGVASGETITLDTSTQAWSGPVIFAKDPNSGDFVPLPISTGNWLVLYGTGWMNRASLSQVTVSFGTTELAPVYAGPQLTYPGLDELVVWLPSQLSASTAQTENVVVTVAGAVSNTVQVCIAGSAGGECP